MRKLPLLLILTLVLLSCTQSRTSKTDINTGFKYNSPRIVANEFITSLKNEKYKEAIDLWDFNEPIKKPYMFRDSKSNEINKWKAIHRHLETVKNKSQIEKVDINGIRSSVEIIWNEEANIKPLPGIFLHLKRLKGKWKIIAFGARF